MRYLNKTCYFMIAYPGPSFLVCTILHLYMFTSLHGSDVPLDFGSTDGFSDDEEVEVVKYFISIFCCSGRISKLRQRINENNNPELYHIGQSRAKIIDWSITMKHHKQNCSTEEQR